MSNPCLVCNRISEIEDGTNSYFVAELETGYVVISDFQYFKGYTLFLCKQHKTELHQLDPDFRMNFLREMGEVAEAVSIAFQPKKLNYELLGNSHPHMHWHIFPRYGKDSRPDYPIWNIDNEIRCSEQARPSHEELSDLKKRLLVALRFTVRDIR